MRETGLSSKSSRGERGFTAKEHGKPLQGDTRGRGVWLTHPNRIPADTEQEDWPSAGTVEVQDPDEIMTSSAGFLLKLDFTAKCTSGLSRRLGSLPEI